MENCAVYLFIKKNDFTTGSTLTAKKED